MDFVNSKHLTLQDGYLHLFQEEGVYIYGAQVTEQGLMEAGRIIVEGGKSAIGKGQQQDIVFHWDVSSRRYLPRPQDTEKKLGRNDFVLFHFEAPIPGQPPCYILGQIDKKVAFDSRSLGSHDAFSHFFMSGGEYAYRLGKKEFQLSVSDHRELSLEQHTKMAQEPVLIVINGSDPSVKNAKLVAGQTVIWAVGEGQGLSIEAYPAKGSSPSSR